MVWRRVHVVIHWHADDVLRIENVGHRRRELTVNVAFHSAVLGSYLFKKTYLRIYRLTRRSVLDSLVVRYLYLYFYGAIICICIA